MQPRQAIVERTQAISVDEIDDMLGSEPCVRTSRSHSSACALRLALAILEMPVDYNQLNLFTF